MRTAVIAALVLSAAGAARQPAPSVLFFDDFAGSALDRSKWNVIVSGRTVNNEQQAYVDSPETVNLVRDASAEGAENGALEIRPRYRAGFETADGRSFDFTSGRLESRGKFDFTYGTAAARIKMTAGAGLWPAFWLLGNDGWPATGEIDVMENVGDPLWTSVALHGAGYSGNTPLVARHEFAAGSDITSWHVYSVDWSPDLIVFKVDDVEVYRATKATVERHGAWAYDTLKFVILNFALGGAYPQGVNKVNAPYPGLSAETVDLIKADRARFLVDWVRVTRR
ncbi:MAG: glycoside hydrolase family 16 protein [Acidobacteria bacterium]|nr:glycoside hydrolase family 16 protein [Acidobacteriota bacterium]